MSARVPTSTASTALTKAWPVACASRSAARHDLAHATREIRDETTRTARAGTASLAILEVALGTTVNALLLAQPELLTEGDLDQRSLPTPALVASGTISRCLDLVASINRYRLALSIEQPENDPLPF